MTFKPPIGAVIGMALMLSATPQHRLAAQVTVSASDSTAIMEAALDDVRLKLSSKRRFIDPANDGHELSASRAARLSAKVKATVARRDAYTTCDESRHCRIANDAELVEIEPPILVGKDKARVRVIARQGTNIKRMPESASTFSYALERRAGVWTVTGVRVTRQ